LRFVFRSFLHPEKRLYAASVALSKWVNGFGKPMVGPFARILMVKLDELGDMATATHAFELLKRANPHAEMVLWCKKEVAPLVQNDPNINRVVTNAQELEANPNFDLIVDLRPSWASLTFAWKHRPNTRVDRASIRYRNSKQGAHPHEVVTNYQIVEPLVGALNLQIPADLHPRLYPDEASIYLAKAFIEENTKGPFVMMHVGARRPLRRWPANQFAALANRLQAAYGLQTVWVGGPEDEPLIAQVTALTHQPTARFQGNLMAFCALARHAALFVGNDSGPMHLAAAMDAPTLGLFGPGEPHVFGPWGTRTAFLHHKLPCNPCDQVHCVRPENPCIQLIEVEEAFEACLQLLTQKASTT